jgi:hypothetical protein
MNLRGKPCQCAACGEYFGSLSAFDKHRINLRCRTPDVMEAVGMFKDAQGWWRGSKMSRPDIDSSRACDSVAGDRPVPVRGEGV